MVPHGLIAMKKLIILIILLSSVSVFSQTQLAKGVLGSGGNTISDGNNILRSTIGQSFIGITKSTQSQKSLGFWYSVNRSINDTVATTVVTLPSVESETGKDIEIPLMLVNSRQFAGKSHKWTATIRFNSTILMPIGDTPDCGLDENCSIKISGEFSDSVGVLYNLRFATKLGAVLSTDLVIEDFEWTENITTVTKNGFFQLKGVCETNGKYRLIYRSVDAGITNTFPNPAISTLNIDYQLRESGANKMEIINTRGDILAVYNDLSDKSGVYSITKNISDIPSGIYYLVLTTPNDIYTSKIAIEK
ncbi:T9SS type A sorting domain-containing protein [bacterium]|nr:MAG: T9SS type A sorting domain-containing protein [bacterium]